LSSLIEQLTFGDVYVDVATGSGFGDIWSCREEVIKGATGATCVGNQIEHLSWFVVAITLDFPLEDAVMLARAGSVSRETWPFSREHFFTPVLENEALNIRVGWATAAAQATFPNIEKLSLGLYPVVDSVDWIERLLKLGIRTIQLRIKDKLLPNLEGSIEKAIALGREYDAQVFINDHWQLAVKYRAFGVHLGQEDIEVADLNELAENDIALGLSTHGYYELLRIAQLHPSYIALGHIFPTTTKEMPSKPQGLVRLALYQTLINSMQYGQLKGIPTVAIGGIDLNTAPAVWQCGVSSLAVVRAITLSDNVVSVVSEFSKLMEGDPDAR
jgi:thiamine-phosphate pyrophosphorylase